MGTSRSPELSFRIMHPHAAGVDIGNTAHYAAVPPESCREGESCVRRFETFTADLHLLADWLKEHQVDTVALESTGVYWIPLFEVLESRGFQVCLVDARRSKSLPGRKTDVKDCQWLQQLHTCGLLHSAFRPEDEICVLRSYLRQRDMLISSAADHIQHVQKALQQMNVKLSNVISDVTGQTGMAIIQAILDGERDPLKLAKLRDRRCKNSEEVIAKSLVGNWRDDHLFELRQGVELVRFYQQKVRECDVQIESWLNQLPDRRQDPQSPLPKRKAKRNPHAPEFDARSSLHRVTGVDLTSINGIEANTALKIVSEIGSDITRWPSVKHFCSWLCLCPGNKKSGGKVLSSRTRRSRNRVAAALRMAAQSLERSQTALGASYRRMKSRLGAPEAITATAHKLARIVYSLLRHGQPFVDVGQEAYEQMYQTRIRRSLQKRALQLGFQLIPLSTST
jgi:transposase